MEEQKKVLIHIYGDSLSLPRNTEGVPYYKIYSEMLKDKIQASQPDQKIYLYNWSRGDATIEYALNELKRHIFYFSCKGNILILQIGVCDCAPRPIPLWLREYVSRLPSFLRKPIVRFLHNYRATIQKLGIYWQNTKPQVFEKKVKDFVSLAEKNFERVYIINIAPTNSETEKHSPGFGLQISNYNKILHNVAKTTSGSNIKFVDIHREIAADPQGIQKFINKDGHHLTSSAHELYLNEILKVEEIIVPSKR
jgi:hypothetical protein